MPAEPADEARDVGHPVPSRKLLAEFRRHDLVGSMGQVGAARGQRRHGILFALLQYNVLDRRR